MGLPCLKQEWRRGSKVLQAEPLDLVVLDLYMEPMDGF